MRYVAMHLVNNGTPSMQRLQQLLWCLSPWHRRWRLSCRADL